jgi:hypothetical protein
MNEVNKLKKKYVDPENIYHEKSRFLIFKNSDLQNLFKLVHIIHFSKWKRFTE